MRLRGFTLLELLVALSITVLLAGLLLAGTLNLLQVGQRTQGAATVALEARLVLDQLERDLQSAVRRDDGRAWISGRILAAGEFASHGWNLTAVGVLKPDATSLRPRPAVPLEGGERQISAARFGRSGLWLRFVTADYDGALEATLPAAVSYQVVRRAVSSSAAAPVRYALFREKMSAADTFNLVLPVLFTASAPAALNQPDNGDVIASNVVDFGVWIATRDSIGAETLIYPVADTDAEFATTGVGAVIWAMVRVLTEEGAARIDAIERGMVLAPTDLATDDWWWQEVEAHSRVFVRRIELKGAPQ